MRDDPATVGRVTAQPAGDGPRRGRAGAARVTVTVCRGCCCGTQAKHPDVDHPGQLASLDVAVGGQARLRVTSCLGVCEHSNVLVVNPSAAGRMAGGRPAWLEHVLDDEAVGAVVAWVRAGGPGIAATPPQLRTRVFVPGGRAADTDQAAAEPASAVRR